MNYLSLIFDGNLNYIWKIPKALRNYDEYNHRLLIKNINNNSIIKEIYFSINQNNKTITNTQTTSNIGSSDNQKENDDDNEENICIYKLCIPNYALALIIIGVLIILCICIKCCCC